MNDSECACGESPFLGFRLDLKVAPQEYSLVSKLTHSTVYLSLSASSRQGENTRGSARKQPASGG